MDAIEHGDNVKERKDRVTHAIIYQVVLEDVLLMLAEVAWETLQCV